MIAATVVILTVDFGTWRAKSDGPIKERFDE